MVFDKVGEEEVGGILGGATSQRARKEATTLHPFMCS